MDIHQTLCCVLIVCISVAQAVRPQCGLYGAPPCTYVPAPPGQTPSCAKPGSTYCERMHHYPMKVVNQLITRFGFDINKLLIDETGDELRTSTEVFGPIHGYHVHGSNQPNYKQYIPNQAQYSGNAGYSYPNPNTIPTSGGYNYPAPNSVYQNDDPIYIPKPRPQSTYPARNSYQTPNHAPAINYVIERQQITEYNPSDAFRRYTRGIAINHKLRKYSDKDEVEEALEEDLLTSSNRTRTKRQSSGRIQLCDVNTQFIMPQAALNSQGNWMYVINQDNMSRQLVKTETCASSVCTNLCQLPNGYNSRCEQKFIQKRLIALDANGQNFYTDTFWFPSCCVCTLSNE